MPDEHGRPTDLDRATQETDFWLDRPAGDLHRVGEPGADTRLEMKEEAAARLEQVVLDRPALASIAEVSRYEALGRIATSPAPTFLTGDAGAGKSSFARGLEAAGFATVSTGDKLRAREAANRRKGDRLKLASAPFGDDDQALEIVAAALFQRAPRVVIDGFPRREAQAQQLIDWSREGRLQPFYLVWFRLPAPAAVRRYDQAGYARSPLSGKYGPLGQECPFGGRYEESIAEHYYDKRREQEGDLSAAFRRLCSAPLEGEILVIDEDY